MSRAYQVGTICASDVIRESRFKSKHKLFFYYNDINNHVNIEITNAKYPGHFLVETIYDKKTQEPTYYIEDHGSGHFLKNKVKVCSCSLWKLFIGELEIITKEHAGKWFPPSLPLQATVKEIK